MVLDMCGRVFVVRATGASIWVPHSKYPAHLHKSILAGRGGGGGEGPDEMRVDVGLYAQTRWYRLVVVGRSRRRHLVVVFPTAPDSRIMY